MLLAELLDVLQRSHLAARLEHAGVTATGIVQELRGLAVVVAPQTVPQVVASDPDDDHVLAAAVVAGSISSHRATGATCCR